MSSFIHLHTHSDYSLLRSTITVESLVKRAAKYNMKSVALTDENNLFAASYFFQICSKHGVKPIIGCDFTIAAAGIHNKTQTARKSGITGSIVLLAENIQGYQNLTMLSSAAYLEGFYYYPRIDYELLAQYPAGLICLTGGSRGEITRMLQENKFEDAQKTLRRYIAIFGKDRTFVEICSADFPLLPSFLSLAESEGVEIVASNNCYYMDAEDEESCNALRCIGMNKKLAEYNQSDQGLYFRSQEEMEQLFSENPEALRNTLCIAERCNVDFPRRNVQLPEYRIPAGFSNESEYLRHICNRGLHSRYGSEHKDLDALRERSNYELDTIISMGFTGYFLIVWDVIRFAHESGIPVGPGRGSGAGSLVAYLLNITDIDPIRYNLLFERFLNPSRISMPDFDIDFCMEERGKIIEYITEKYGTDRVGQIITFGKLKARAVIRDVSRILDIPYNTSNNIVSLIPYDPTITLPKILKENAQIKKLYNSNEQYKKLFSIAKKLEGLNRHASTHPAGIVIGKEKIIDYLPLYKDPRSGAISTQFPMDVLESCGLVKMDFLGLKTLTIIKHVEEIIRTKDPAFSIKNIPENDKKTYSMLSRGDGLAVFQLESEGMQQILKQAKPERIEDIIAIISLFRPGPMQFVDKYIAAKSGKMSISYLLPTLKNILEETYGVIIYQEQVMQIVQQVAGFDLGEADILRRVMGKKLSKEMRTMKQKFVDGAVAKGHTATEATTLFEMLQPFADYGFNKSHAAAYAILAYQTAYLKANFTPEFFAANLSCEISFPDKFSWYMRNARQYNITIRPPDIYSSMARFSTSADGEIIYGLTGIKFITMTAAEHIISLRNSGELKNLYDLLVRCNLQIITRKIVVALIVSGCFDSMYSNRKALLHYADDIRKLASTKADSIKSGQDYLFAEEDEMALLHSQLNTYNEQFTTEEVLHLEDEYLGTYFSGHPLDSYRQLWKLHARVAHLGNISSLNPGNYTFIGIIRDSKRIQTKNGNIIVSATLEDYHGNTEIVIYHNTPGLEQLQEGKVYIVTGRLETMRNTQIVVTSLERGEHAREIHIKLKDTADENALHDLRSCLERIKGKAPVILHLPGEKREMRRLRIRSKSCNTTFTELKKLSCVQSSWTGSEDVSA